MQDGIKVAGKTVSEEGPDLTLLEPQAGPSTPILRYSPHPRSPARNLLPPSPIPIMALPPSASLVTESLASSELELDRQTRQLARERELAEALQDQQFEVERQNARNTSFWTMGKGKQKAGGATSGSNGPTKGFAHPPQAYELYQAIDKHDIEFIMRVRDHAFNLLLQKNAGEFPIVYAGRIGPSHRDIVILLIGALSRYVNHLEDEDFEKKETKGTLKALSRSLQTPLSRLTWLMHRIKCTYLFRMYSLTVQGADPFSSRSQSINLCSRPQPPHPSYRPTSKSLSCRRATHSSTRRSTIYLS